MEESLLQFPQQFDYEPEIVNGDHLPSFQHFVLNGMGGSHLHADLLKNYDPSIDLTVHSNYGLPLDAHHPPARPEAADETLFIASSHSGNTEEVVDFVHAAHEQGYYVACIATGGALIEFAQDNGLPYIQMPDTGIQPRTALGFALLALAKFVRPALIGQLQELKDVLDPSSVRERGEEIAQQLKDHVPVICSSVDNISIAYNWKIKFNETGKIPSFYNVFPELNHNEMHGFDAQDANAHLSERMTFIFIRDDRDHERIQKRMDICGQQYEERGFKVVSVHLDGEGYFERAFHTLLMADWAALKTAEIYGTEPEEVPMIEEFKERIQ